MIVFCSCGSDKVHVKQWQGARALYECATCERTAWVEGFTLSKLDVVAQLCGAVIDQARKYRERPPQERSKLLEEHLQRKSAGRR